MRNHGYTIIAFLYYPFLVSFIPCFALCKEEISESNHGYTIIARIFFRAIMVIQLLRLSFFAQSWFYNYCFLCTNKKTFLVSFFLFFYFQKNKTKKQKKVLKKTTQKTLRIRKSKKNQKYSLLLKQNKQNCFARYDTRILFLFQVFLSKKIQKFYK